MTREVRYTVDCRHCGGDSSCIILDSAIGDEGQITIDLEMVATQQEFVCDDCKRLAITGDLDVMMEPDECDDEDDEDDDEDDEPEEEGE